MEGSRGRTSSTTSRTSSGSGADIRVSRTASSCDESMRAKEWRQQQQQQAKSQTRQQLHQQGPEANAQQLHQQHLRHLQPHSHHQQGLGSQMRHQQQQQQQQQHGQQQQRRKSLVSDQRERSHSFHESPRMTATNHRPLPGHYGMQQQPQQQQPPLTVWNSSSSNRKIGHHPTSESELSAAESIYENVTSSRHSQKPTTDSSSSSAMSSSTTSNGSGTWTASTTTTEVAMRLRPALERERRSLRKLTKDSGYETSPYSESDYANMEWLSDQNSEHGVVSPSPTRGRHHPAASLCPYWDTASSDQEAAPYSLQHHQRVSWTQYKAQMERSYPGRMSQSAGSRNKSAIHADSSSFVDYSKGSVSSSDALRRLSQGNVWLAQQQQQQLQQHHLEPHHQGGRYSSTDSLCSSYSSGTSGGGRFTRYPPPPTSKVVSAKSTPSLHYRNDGSSYGKGLEDKAGVVLQPSASAASVTAADVLVASMNSSRSTPNLGQEAYGSDETAIMGRVGSDGGGGGGGGAHLSSSYQQQQQQHGQRPRSASNSSSSGGPQLQPRYHCRQVSSQSTASSDGTSSSSNSQWHHSRQESGQSSYSEDDGRVISPLSEDFDGTAFTYHGSVSLHAFPSDRYDAEDLLDDHWASLECDSYTSGLMSSPPPPMPPVRDGSSMKYMMANDYHETFSSSSGLSESGSQRSSAVDAANEKAVVYARLKKYAQSYTHQLKTVVEKSERMVGLSDDPRLITTAYQSMQLERKIEPHFAMPLGSAMQSSSMSERREVSPEKYDRVQHVDSSKMLDEHGGGGGHLAKHSDDSSSSESCRVVDDTPLLDRLRLESKHWSSDCGLDKVKRSGGRDSITSTTSSQETLKWHGSSSDVSVNSDKQASRSFTTTVEGGVVHSARVKPPQRHNSESVLYYGTEEMVGNDGTCQAYTSMPVSRAVQRVKPNKRDSPPARQAIWRNGDCCDPMDDKAPPLPRKTRQWSDQVQKNNYINQIKMQIRPLADNAGSSIRTGSLAREEIQPPVSPEFAKPLSVAERIQDLERQARSVGSNRQVSANSLGAEGGQRSPYVLVAGLSTKMMNGAGAAPAATDVSLPEMRMAYLDPEKKHKVSDPELKAIQKQAVLSFFERQTRIVAGGNGKGSASRDSSAKTTISRRLAQSLPRDYFQEFKRMQHLSQSDERRYAASKVALSPMRKVSDEENKISETSTRASTSSSSRHAEEMSPSRRHLLSSRLHRQISMDRLSTTSGSGSNSGSSSSTASSMAATPVAMSPTLPSSPSSKDRDLLGGGSQPEGEHAPMYCNEAVQNDHEKYVDAHPDEATCQNFGASVNGIFSASAVIISAPIVSERLKDTGGSSITREVKLKSPTRVVEQLPNRGHGSMKDTLSSEYDEASRNEGPGGDGQLLKYVDGDRDDYKPSQPQTSSDNVACSKENAVLRIEEYESALPGSTSTDTSVDAHRVRRRLLMAAERNAILMRNSGASPIANVLSQSSRCSTPELPLPPPPPHMTADDATFYSNEPLPPPPTFNDAEWDIAESNSSRSPKESCLSFHKEPRSPSRIDTANTTSDHSSSLATRFLSTGNMETTTVSPNTWEQWHNVRQSNTTLVFHSNEMVSSKPSHLKPLSRAEATNGSIRNESPPRISEFSKPQDVELELATSETVARHSPPSRAGSRGSTESLRSNGSGGSGVMPAPSLSGLTTTGEDRLESHSYYPSPSKERASNSVGYQDVHIGSGPFTEATTQTTPSAANVSNNGRMKREAELECERLSRDLFNHLSGQDTALRHILVPSPDMKTMADYMEGLLEMGNKDCCSPKQQPLRLLKSSKCSTPCSSLSSNVQTKSVPLPSDSAYFTTSESKAKFLNRYSQDVHRSFLDDVHNGSELAKKKEELVNSITRKLEILRTEHVAVREEIRVNEDLGSSVTHRVEQLARPNEVDKFKLHVEEVDKITSLLLGLSGRLARAENALMTLPANANEEEKRLLEAKRNKLCDQLEEAKKLKENIDRRSCQVSEFLHKYFSSDEYADYDHFVKMKVKLLMDFREIDDKIKLGEEQMAALKLNL